MYNGMQIIFGGLDKGQDEKGYVMDAETEEKLLEYYV